MNNKTDRLSILSVNEPSDGIDGSYSILWGTGLTVFHIGIQHPAIEGKKVRSFPLCRAHCLAASAGTFIFRLSHL